MPARQRTASLAARIVALTLGIVALTVLVTSAIALTGVYTMLRSAETAALVSRRQMVVDVLQERLDGARRVVGSLSAGLAGPSSESVWPRTLLRTAETNAETFDVFAVLDTTGTILASAQSGASVDAIPEAVVARGRDTRGDVAFVEPVEAGRSKGRIWLVTSFASGDRRCLLAVRVRAGMRDTLVEELDSPDSAIALLNSRNQLISSGTDGPRLDLGAARFEPASGSASGEALGLRSPAGAMHAYWSNVGVAEGLGWRVLVAAPKALAMQQTRTALYPASLMVLAASLAAMVVSTFFARRLVQPLDLFEERARDVASGILVSPLEVSRDDELGRLADAFNAMLARLNAMRELARLLARSAHLDEVLRGTLAATTRLLGADVLPLVFLLEGDRLRLASASSTSGLPANLTVLAAGDEWPATAVTRSEALYGHLLELEAGTDPFAAAGLRSGLALPLLIAGQPTGVLAAMSRTERTFSEAEKEMLRTFAVQAAMAIENSRLFEEERTSRREAEALREVAEELEGVSDVLRAIETVAAIAGDLLGGAEARVVLAAASGLDADPRAFAEYDALYEQAAAQDEHSAVAIAPSADAAPDDCWTLLVPLYQDVDRRGMLVVRSAGGAAAFSEREMSLATTIGREVSLALENAHLLQKARDRADNLERIFRISQAVSSSLQSNVVLNRVLDVVQKIFAAPAVSLMTFDGAKRAMVTAMARGLSDREMLYLELEPGEDLQGRVFANGRAEVFLDLPSLATPVAKMAVASGFGSLLAVPLLARGRSIGVLSLFGSRDEEFDGQDVELLQTFATQAALAIDTAQLYGREHRVASVLQASILPETMPQIPELDISTVYRPVSEEAEIGGDYYDVFPARDGRIILAIADVAGKGVFAATKTSMIRYALRGMVAAGLGPGEALTQLNKMVVESGDPSDIVTVWVGALDLERRRLAWADAGHPPGLVFQPGAKRVERLTPTGPVLGGITGAVFAEEEVSMEPGATVLLYTDGVTEARRDTEFFGEGRVRRALSRGGTAQETAVRLLTTVERFAGSGLRDDAAVLVVRLRDGRGRAV